MLLNQNMIKVLAISSMQCGETKFRFAQAMVLQSKALLDESLVVDKGKTNSY